jgi:hypothetical protein
LHQNLWTVWFYVDATLFFIHKLHPQYLQSQGREGFYHYNWRIPRFVERALLERSHPKWWNKHEPPLTKRRLIVDIHTLCSKTKNNIHIQARGICFNQSRRTVTSIVVCAQVEKRRVRLK